MNGSTLWVILFFLLFLDLLVVALRTSLLTLNSSQILNLREHNHQTAEMLVKLLEKPHLRISLRLAIVLIHFTLAPLGGWLFIQKTGLQASFWPLLLGTLLTALLLLLLEFLVDGMVLRKIVNWAVRLTPLGRLLDVLMRPLTSIFLLLLGKSASQQILSDLDLEGVLKSWASSETSDNEIVNDERRMIYSVFQFSNTLCREIMVPRIDIFALEVNTGISEVIPLAMQSGHSRVPVYEGNIDNIIGLLYVKDLLRIPPEHKDEVSLSEILRAAYYVPEAKRVSELFREMQAREVHMVVVVDEYGGTAGLVTLEDIMEEVFGEIRDEYDQAEELLYEEVSPQEYVFQGRIDIDDFNDVLNTHLTREIADTLGGFIYGEIGRVPSEGETVQVEDWQLTVEQVSRRRIRKVRARRYTPLEMEENNEAYE